MTPMTKSVLALAAVMMIGALGAGQAVALEQDSRSEGCVFVPEQGLLVCPDSVPVVPASLSEPVDGGPSKKVGISFKPGNLQLVQIKP
jgi:hypothetical protein